MATVMSIWYTVLTCTPISPKFPHVYHHTSQKSDKIRKDHEIVILFIGKSYIKIRRSHEFGTILWSTVDHEFSVPNFCTIGVSDRRPWKGAPFLDPQFHPVQQVAGNPLHSVLFSWTIQTWALHFIRKVACIFINTPCKTELLLSRSHTSTRIEEEHS